MVISIVTINLKITFLHLFLMFFLTYFQEWILSHFHHIHGFECLLSYIEDYPCVCMYHPCRGNDVVKLFCVYIDQTEHDDIKWISYTSHERRFHSTPFHYTSDVFACIFTQRAIHICQTSGPPTIYSYSIYVS